MPIENRGLYGQVESNAAADNAAAERDADTRADRDYQTYVGRAVKAVDAEVKAFRAMDRAENSKRPGIVRKSVQARIDAAKSLQAEAVIIDDMKANGFSQMTVESIINVGRYVRRARNAEVYGAEASSDVTPKEIRIKSDGKGAVSLIGNAARNGSILKHRPSNAGYFLTRDNTTGKDEAEFKKERAAYARHLAEIKRGFSPLPDDHAGRKAEYNDVDDPEVLAAASYVIDGGEVFE